MRSEPFLYRSWAEIDTEQIIKNYKIYRNFRGIKRNIIAVVKANAYGHGDAAVSRILEEYGVNFFAVSNISEAVNLRKCGITGKILVLGYIPISRLQLLNKYNIIGTVVSEAHLEELKMYAPKNAEFHIAIDTEMHRIGIGVKNCENTIKVIKNAAKTLKITGIFTHLAVADSDAPEDIASTNFSLKLFEKICEGIKALGISDIHCLNSSGGLNYFKEPFSTVRLGISLYGYSSSEAVVLPEGVLPALEWKTNVACVVDIKAGDSVGYGKSYIAKKDMKVATLMTGYADGYPRLLSNNGKVLINGEFAPVVGKICMDMMMVDITETEKVKPGDTAVLIGTSKNKKITADDLAKAVNTVSYEILTGISSRVERIYK